MSEKYDIVRTNKFKKQYAKFKKKQKFKDEELEYVVEMLANNEVLPPKYKNHLLEPKKLRNLGMSYTTRCIARI